MLEVKDLVAGYRKINVLWGIDFFVEKNEIVSIVGPNGAGKTSLIKSILGFLDIKNGTIKYENEVINSLSPHKIVSKGISCVVEGRKVFPELSVEENLFLGGHKLRHDDMKIKLDFVYELFPILKERRKQHAGTLSGGEQQILAIGRALMTNPKLLILDEPSLGLAPKIVSLIYKTIKQLNELGLTILLVEQQVMRALKLSNRAYILDNGKIVMSGSGDEMLKNEHVVKTYLGLE